MGTPRRGGTRGGSKLMPTTVSKQPQEAVMFRVLRVDKSGASLSVLETRTNCSEDDQQKEGFEDITKGFQCLELSK